MAWWSPATACWASQGENLVPCPLVHHGAHLLGVHPSLPQLTECLLLPLSQFSSGFLHFYKLTHSIQTIHLFVNAILWSRLCHVDIRVLRISTSNTPSPSIEFYRGQTKLKYTAAGLHLSWFQATLDRSWNSDCTMIGTRGYCRFDAGFIEPQCWAPTGAFRALFVFCISIFLYYYMLCFCILYFVFSLFCIFVIM